MRMVPSFTHSCFISSCSGLSLLTANFCAPPASALSTEPSITCYDFTSNHNYFPVPQRSAKINTVLTNEILDAKSMLTGVLQTMRIRTSSRSSDYTCTHQEQHVARTKTATSSIKYFSEFLRKCDKSFKRR